MTDTKWVVPKTRSPFKSQARTKRMFDVAAGIVVVLVVAFAMAPIVWTLLTSFKTESQIVSEKMNYLPSTLTFENYSTLWRRSGYPHLLKNSAIVTGLTVLLSLTIGILGGYGISRYRFHGRSVLMIFFLVIRMFPFTLMLIPLFILL